MSIYDYDMLDEMEDGDILFFDEILNGNPVTLNACLTFIGSRRTISGKSLKDIIIVAAANPQGAAPITPQIKERFVFYECKFSPEMWKKYLVGKYNIPDRIVYKLCDYVKSEDYKSTMYNFYSPRSIDKAIDSLIRGMNTPYEKFLSYILNDYKLSVPHNTEIVNEKNETVFMSGGLDDVMNEEIQIGWLDLMKLKYK